MRSAPLITTGIFLALIGLALTGGGIWLAALGGSVYYIIAGLGILITGALLMARHRLALWVYAAVLIGTLVWAFREVGFDWWPLAARRRDLPDCPLVAHAMDRAPSRSRSAGGAVCYIAALV